MGEVVWQYPTQLRGRDGRLYGVQAAGRERDDSSWEGWLEFLPLDGGQTVSTERETTQPDREKLEYWASGLTDPYLDGALLRALTVLPHVEAPHMASSESTPRLHVRPAGSAASGTVAILDPFQVYKEGADILRRQLLALSADQVQNIVRAYHLGGNDSGRLQAMSHAELVECVISGVEKRGG